MTGSIMSTGAACFQTHTFLDYSFPLHTSPCPIPSSASSKMTQPIHEKNPCPCANVIKIIVSIDKEKSPPAIYKTNRWAFFTLKDFSIIGYRYFPICFHIPNVLNATVMDVYLSILLEQLANWRYKPGVVLENTD